MATLRGSTPRADAGGSRRPPISPSGAPGALRVRLLGGFEVWRDDRPVEGFESQKVRALFAYLLCNRQRAFSRDHLAGLLWPERSAEASRHALRQAVYNLKSALPGSEPVLAGSLGVQLNPAADVWIDVEAFEESLRRGKGREGTVDPFHLTTAVQLYRGELLSGFFVKDSEAFEDWLLGEQERLREAAIDVLRTLVDTYRRRGEYRFGLHYARRVVALEPLSEEACRDLMRMNVLAGRRSRALAEFEKLQALLKSELGVEPLKETRALYESILLDTHGEAEVEIDPEPIGPLIPLAGRSEALGALLADWEQVKSGRGRVTLVVGEAGAGKTRLIKSFLDAATSRGRATVLKGRGDDPPMSYQPVAQALAGVLHEEGGAAEQALAEAPPALLADLALLCPDLRELRRDIPLAEPLTGAAGLRRLFDAVASFLASLCSGENGDPLILFVDDLQRADAGTLSLLRHLAERLAARPAWILASCRTGHEVHLRAVLAGREGLQGAEITLGRLPADALREIAESLVAEEQAGELSRFLAAGSGGVPLDVAERINFLWDEGVLVPAESASWRLDGSLHGLAVPGEGTVDDLLRHRIQRLPSSTRRLATLAAVAGPSFDFALLEQAGDEHPVVVEVGLELLLKRWLLRQHLPNWESGRRRRDLTLWTEGMRRGRFEFAHRHIPNVLLGAIDPPRRRALHAQVAAALEALPEAEGGRLSEVLAHQWAAAGDWAKAIVHLERSLAKARGLHADVATIDYYRQALHLATRSGAGAAAAEAAAAHFQTP